MSECGILILLTVTLLCPRVQLGHCFAPPCLHTVSDCLSPYTRVLANLNLHWEAILLLYPQHNIMLVHVLAKALAHTLLALKHTTSCSKDENCMHFYACVDCCTQLTRPPD